MISTPNEKNRMLKIAGNLKKQNTFEKNFVDKKNKQNKKPAIRIIKRNQEGRSYSV